MLYGTSLVPSRKNVTTVYWLLVSGWKLKVMDLEFILSGYCYKKTSPSASQCLQKVWHMMVLLTWVFSTSCFGIHLVENFWCCVVNDTVHRAMTNISFCNHLSSIVSYIIVVFIYNPFNFYDNIRWVCRWGQPEWPASEKFDISFLNLLCHLYTCWRETHAYPYGFVISWWISAGFSPSLPKKRITACCSSHPYFQMSNIFDWFLITLQQQPTFLQAQLPKEGR